MSAPQITNIAIPSGEVMYPRRISIVVTFDQPIIYPVDQPDRVVFEAKTAIDFVTGDNNNPSNPVGLGQVLVESRQISPNQTEFSFQISPFANGPLQLSNRPWNLPFLLNAENSWGEPADWTAFLAPGLFESVVQKPYFSWIQVRSPHVLYGRGPANYPLLDRNSICFDEVSNNNPGIELKFGTNPAFPATPLYDNFWNEGRFWWGYDICAADATKDLFAPGVRRQYAYSTQGFQITNTHPAGPCPPFPNSGGANPRTGFPRQYFNFNECQTKDYCVCGWIHSRVLPEPGWEWYGRMNNWIISTPNIDFVQPGRKGWYNQYPLAGNDYNLAPWNLFAKDKGAGMLFQCYIAQGWYYNQDTPPPIS